MGIGDLVSIKSIDEFTEDCILGNWLSVTGACDGTMDGGRRSRTGRQRRVRRREGRQVLERRGCAQAVYGGGGTQAEARAVGVCTGRRVCRQQGALGVGARIVQEARDFNT